MKKLLSLLLALTVFVGIIPTFSVSAEAPLFSTDFSNYSVSSGCKQYCDASGSYVPNGYTFSKTDDGLRYYRNKSEVFYNPSRAVKTDLPGYRVIYVSTDGTKNGTFAVEADTAYCVTFVYNAAVVNASTPIDLNFLLTYPKVNADGATGGGGVTKPLTLSDGITPARIDKPGEYTVTSYFYTGTLGSYNGQICDRVFLYLKSAIGDFDITFKSLTISKASSINIYEDGLLKNSVYGKSGDDFTYVSSTESEEKYFYNGIGKYTGGEQKLYTDKALTNIAENVKFTEKTQDFYTGSTFSTENQVCFTGFDNYTGNTPDNTSLTTDYAYSGDTSLEVTLLGGNTSVIEVGGGKTLSKGATYKLSFYTLCTEDIGNVIFGFTSGKNETTLSTGITKTVDTSKLDSYEKFFETCLIYTCEADGELPYLTVSPESKTSGLVGTVYIDTVTLSAPLNYDGASILTEEAAAAAGSQAVRVFYKYDLTESGAVNLAGDIKKIAKRGVLISRYTNNLLKIGDDNVINYEKTDFNECWDYDTDSAETVYSIYINGFTDSYKNCAFASRGYIILDDGTVYYSQQENVSINNIKNKQDENSMYYEIFAPASGNDFGDFYLYVPAGDSNHEYYAQYRFVYKKNPPDLTLNFGNGTDNGCNQQMYRIIEAYLMKKNDTGFAMQHQLLQGGEIELAIKESGAGDFIGGFHGDEFMDFSELYIDGVKADLTKASALAKCQKAEFKIDTVMYRCNSATANAHGTPVAKHSLDYKITSGGIELDQKLQWLVSDFRISSAKVCMCTVMRYSYSKRITDYLEYYKWDGTPVDVIDTTPYGSGVNGGYPEAKIDGPCYTLAYGKESGVIAKCGYKVKSGITGGYDNFCWIRQYNDNKLYYDAEDGTTPASGDTWEWTNYYNFKVNK